MPYMEGIAVSEAETFLHVSFVGHEMHASFISCLSWQEMPQKTSICGREMNIMALSYLSRQGQRRRIAEIPGQAGNDEGSSIFCKYCG